MKNKIYANKGVKRNKKPLQNIVYRITDRSGDLAPTFNLYQLHWQYEKRLNIKPNVWNYHGEVSLDKIKEILEEKQYSKFRQGKRIFTIQRRIDGKNIKK